MASHTNPICAQCAKAYDRLNGRYCTLLDKSVEYDKKPACQSSKNQTSDHNIINPYDYE